MTGPDSRIKLKTVFLSGLLLFSIFSFTPFLYAAGKVSIKDIKYQAFKGYTRVTIYLSGPVEFSMNHLSNPERLYFDLKDTTLPSKTKANFTVGDTILKTIRAKQFNKDTVRVVFDLGKAEDFKASLLNKKNPRLVVDIYAVKSAGKELDVTTPEPTAEKGRPAPREKPDAVTSVPGKPEPLAKKTETDIVPPAPTKPETSPHGKKYTTGKGSIKNIRYKSFKGCTRVTIYLSGPVEFTKNRISKPERLYFDLKNTTLPKKVKAIFSAGDGILKTVRARQYSKDTVRIVLDVEKAEDFNAAIFTKPARLVIDIYAAKPDKKESDVTATPQATEAGKVTTVPEKKPDVSPQAAKKEEPQVQTKKVEPEAIAPVKRLDIVSPSLTKASDVVVTAPSKPEPADKTKDETAGLIESGGKYIKVGEYEKALLDFRKAAEISHGNAELHVYIGRSLFKLGKKEEAIDAYKQALEDDKNSAEAYNGLGYAYYAQGKPTSAIEAFLKAVELNPDHDDARAGLGYTYLTVGNVNGAMEQYRILRSLESEKADELFRLIFKVQSKEQGKEPAKIFK